MVKEIFVNLPVINLQSSIDFFTQLGFKFDSRFTDDSATCMIISQNIFVMLLQTKRFKSFTPNPLCDATKNTEVLLALSVASRSQVDGLIRKALDAGGTTFREPEDHGFMYGQSFQDPDGHIWEVFHMQMSESNT